MEQLRTFFNRYIAEDNMAFTATEMVAAIFVAIVASVGFIVLCAVA